MKRQRGAEEQLALLQAQLGQHVQKRGELADKLRETEQELALLAPRRTTTMASTLAPSLQCSLTDPNLGSIDSCRHEAVNSNDSCRILQISENEIRASC